MSANPPHVSDRGNQFPKNFFARIKRNAALGADLDISLNS